MNIWHYIVKISEKISFGLAIIGKYKDREGWGVKLRVRERDRDVFHTRSVIHAL